MSEAMINVLKLAKTLRESADKLDDIRAGERSLMRLAADALDSLQAQYAKECDIVMNLTEDRDQPAFIFTYRLKALCDEFDGKISTAAAIGAFEVVKHELIAEALEQSNVTNT